MAANLTLKHVATFFCRGTDTTDDMRRRRRGNRRLGLKLCLGRFFCSFQIVEAALWRDKSQSEEKVACPPYFDIALMLASKNGHYQVALSHWKSPQTHTHTVQQLL